MKIIFTDIQKCLRLKSKVLKKIANTILDILGIEKKLSLVLVDSKTIKDLNKRFFRKDNLTDVISFYLEDEDDPLDIWGEVIICTEVIVKNAKRWKRLIEEELFLCIIHGILHLIGFRDTSLKDRKRMFRFQERILNILKRRFPKELYLVLD